MRIKRLELQNFRSFYGQTTVDFPEKGLLLIRGSSLDHGDSSGSGKSSLLLAISYALGICPLPATALTSWGAEGPMQVTLVLESKDHQLITLQRGKKNALFVEGREITGAKNIDETFRLLTRLDPAVLAAITYRVQGTRGVFLSMTDADKKDFLTGLLGLGIIEDAIEKAEEELANLEVSLKDKQDIIRTRDEKIAWLRAQTPPPLPETSVDHQRIDKLRADMAEWKKTGSFLQKPEPSSELKKLEKGLEVVKTKLVALRGKNKEAQDTLARQQRDARNIQNTRRDLQNLQRQRRQVEVGLQNTKCPTCEQTWQNAEKLRSVQAEIRETQMQLDSLPESALLESLIGERFEPSPEIAEWEAAQTKLQNEYTTLRANDTAQFLAKQSMHLHQYTSMERELQALESQARNEAFATKQREDWIRNHEIEIAGIEGQQIFVRDRMAATEKSVNAEKDFLALMGRKGFLGVIFDDVLAEIREEVNSQLGKLANVSQVTLDFVSESYTKAGTTKKVITPVFYVNGHETRLEMLSGGMQTSVELVVDLALMTIVQRRTGALPGWLLLDEAFNGQGTITKEAALEALRVYAEDKLIVVVDHSSETKEFFSQVIEVQNTGGRSAVVL